MAYALVKEDNLNCSICYGILRDPIECIHCTINYCRECVDKIKDSNKKKNLPDLCPLCKKEWILKENTIFRDFLTKQIKSFCSICKKPYISLEDHKPKCKEYKCKVCEKKFYTDDFMRHLMNSHKQIVLNLSNSNFKGDPFPKKNKEPSKKINEFLSIGIGIEKNKANYIEGEYINLFRPNNEIPLPNENISIPSYLFLASNNLYYCGKKTNLNCGCCNGLCKIGNCLCKRCMEFNKELKYLKPYYLINKYARAAKYGFGSFWCMGEYINYSEVNGIKMKKCIQCMHPNNPCPGCQTLNKLYKEYLSPEVYEKFS